MGRGGGEMAGETMLLKFAPCLLDVAEQRLAGKLIAEAAEKGLLKMAATEGSILAKSVLATGDVLNVTQSETSVLAKTLSAGKLISFGKVEATVVTTVETTAVKTAETAGVKTAATTGKDLVALHPRYAKGGFPSDYVPKGRKFVEVRAKVVGNPHTYQGKNGTVHQDFKIEVQEILKPLQGTVVQNAAAKFAAKSGAIGGQIVEGAAKGKVGGVNGTIEVGMKLTVSHNVSIGAKVPLQKGDEIIVRGMPFSKGYAGLHWTHHAMNPNDAGFIKLIRTLTRFQ
jgi:hypothetical protein